MALQGWHTFVGKKSHAAQAASRSACDYWQSILIYANNSAILTMLFVVLISDIPSITFKYLVFRCAFNT